MKKKILSIILLGCMVLSLVGCGNSGKADEQQSDKTPVKNDVAMEYETETESESKNDNYAGGTQTEQKENTENTQEPVCGLVQYFNEEITYEKKDFSIPYLNRTVTQNSKAEDFVRPEDFEDEDAYFYQDEHVRVSDNKEFKFWGSAKNRISRNIYTTEPEAEAEFYFYTDEKKGMSTVNKLMQAGNWGIDLGECEKYFGIGLHRNGYGVDLAGLEIISIMEEILGKPDEVYATNSVLIKENVSKDSVGSSVIIVYRYNDFLIFFDMDEIYENEKLVQCTLFKAYICSESFLESYLDEWSEYDGELERIY